VLFVAIVLGAAVLRFASLGRPVDLVFDEIFYARDACWYVIGTQDVCGITDLASRAHPPLGKWLIGAGIALFGYDPFGWRVASAVLGTATVALVYPMGLRLLRPITTPIAATVGAAAGAGLLALDFLHLVHSRVGMLDAFIAFFVVGAVLGAVLDRDRNRDRIDTPWWWRLTLGRPWRLVAGICLGAAAAVKVVGGVRRSGGHRPRRRVGDRRAQAAGARRRMGGVDRRRVPAGGPSDVRPAGDRAAARVRRQLHRPDARAS
jgi:dolichyl-phosphate-mannose--protein O-mannosyl transferase